MELFRKNTLLATTIAASSLGLVACHDDENAPAAVEPPPVVVPAPEAVSTISGVALKGPLALADVFACLAGSPCVTATTEIPSSEGFAGQTTTDANGEYTLTSTVVDEVIVIRLVTTADTTQVCDYVGCDESVGVGLELTTVTFAEETADGEAAISAPVNVISSIAAETFIAQAATVTDKASFDTASTAASTATAETLGLTLDAETNLLTVDLVAATPEELTAEGNSADVKSLALIAASIASSAVSEDGVISTEALSTVITSVAETVSEVVVAVAAGEATEEQAAAIVSLTDSIEEEITINVAAVVEEAPTAVIVPPTVTAPVIPVTPPVTTGASSGSETTGDSTGV